MAPVEVEVAVDGAGAAGLAAAAELRAQGRSVVVLEARDRVGGRTCTDSTTLRAPFDLGASYIHACEQGNPWADIALALGEPVTPDRRRRLLTRGGGSAPTADETDPYAAAAKRTWPLIAGAVDRGWRGAVGDLLPRATEADRWVAALVGPWLCGADTADVDAEDFIRARDGQDWLVPGGYGRLVARFGAAMPVRLGCAVTAVRANLARRRAPHGPGQPPGGARHRHRAARGAGGGADPVRPSPARQRRRRDRGVADGQPSQDRRPLRRRPVRAR